MEGRHDGGMAILGLVVLGSPALSRPRAVTEEQAADGYATMVPLEVLREQYEQAQSRETDLGLRQTALKRQRDHLAAQIPPLQGRRDQDAEVVRLDAAIQRVQAEAAAAERERQRLLDMPRPAPQAAPQEAPGATPARRCLESPPPPQRPPQGQPAAQGGDPRGERRRRIVALLQEYPAGLTPAAIRTRLGVNKRLADTCLGMLRYGVVQRVERGRYVVAAETEGTRRPPA